MRCDLPAGRELGAPGSTDESESSVYGMMYGMKRTTVYLPAEMKADLERLARESGTTEAALLRQGVRSVLADHAGAARPVIPLFDSGAIGAERADELLAGDGSHPAFGEA